MFNESEPVTIHDNGWVLKVATVEKDTRKGVILLLHGWTGDENSMWYFTHHLREHFSFIAPRAPLEADPSGYGWFLVKQGVKSPIQQFQQAADLIHENLSRWLEISGNQAKDPINIMGFSQGAAITLIYSMLYRDQVNKTACLAGFLPDHADTLIKSDDLVGKRYFVAHGSEDEIVPIQKARDVIKFLSNHGAQVTFCEDTIGHKVGANCFGGIARFFNSI